MSVRKVVGLFFAIALISVGALLMVQWDHPISAILEDPTKIFWDSDATGFRINRFWFVGPLLSLVGILWIYDDWFSSRRPD